MILVLIAHNGCTYELEARPDTKLSKVQTALENLTSVPVELQILTLDGTKLDGDKTFGYYDLSEDNFAEGVKVFFYNKNLLLSNSLPPKPEMLPTLKIEYPQLKQYQPHQYPLQQSSAPAVRNLPKYERQFCFHVAKSKAHIEASAEYLRICSRLLAEQEVQALAIDSAQENVDKHYAYISNMYGKFQKHFVERVEQHEKVLGSFNEDLQALEKAETHKIVKESSGIKSVIDLIPKDNLCKWHTQCSAMHAQFKPKAEELTTLFESVKHDVEALFMTVPSVDITKLSERLETNQQLLLEMSSIREVLEKDWLMAKDQLTRGLSQPTHELSQSFLGECAALQSINEIHMNDHMPRIEECSKILERFTKHCIDCKNAMTRCVHSQMKSIAVLQNRISTTRNKLSAYKEVARNIEDACVHLNLVYHIPAAYYSCLAEVVRRRSFADIFSLHAQKFAESMSSLRQNEEVARHNFEQKYLGMLPQELILALKLHLAPPICEVHVSPDEYSMLDIEVSDINDARAVATAESASSKLKKDFSKVLESHGAEDSAIKLQMENATLRAQLASYAAKATGSLQLEDKRDTKSAAAVGGTSGGGGDAGANLDLKEKAEAALEAKDNLISTLANDLTAKDKQIGQYEARIMELEKALEEKEKTSFAEEEAPHPPKEEHEELEQSPTSPKATILSRCTSSHFKVQDIALFIENEKGQYEALNFNSRHYYLSPESLDLCRTQNDSSRSKHMFGQIVHMEKKVAEKDSQYIYSKDLTAGDVYHLLTICLLE